jgi:hypothetical protein
MFKATSEIPARNGSATHLDSLAIEPSVIESLAIESRGQPLPSQTKAARHSQRHGSLSGLPTRASDETTRDASPVPPPKSKTVTVDMLIKWQGERRLSRKEFVKNEGVNPITFTNYTHRNWTLNDYGEDLVKLRTGYKFSPLTIALQTELLYSNCLPVEFCKRHNLSIIKTLKFKSQNIRGAHRNGRHLERITPDHIDKCTSLIKAFETSRHVYAKEHRLNRMYMARYIASDGTITEAGHEFIDAYPPDTDPLLDPKALEEQLPNELLFPDIETGEGLEDFIDEIVEILMTPVPR